VFCETAGFTLVTSTKLILETKLSRWMHFLSVPRSFVDIQITDRQNADIKLPTLKLSTLLINLA
jgi:hypothetical protein